MNAQTFSPEARAHRAWQAGQKLGQRGRWSEAAERYRAARRLQPREALYPMLLGQALLKMEDLEGALEAVRAAAALQPANTALLSAQAQCLKELKRNEELVALLAAAPEESMTLPLLKMLGEAQVHLGREVDAVHTWLQALVKNPADAQLHLRLGYAFHALSMKKEAAECLRTALALGAGQAQGGARDLLCLFEREACDWEGSVGSLARLKEAIRQMPDDAVDMSNPFSLAVLSDDPAVNLKAARAYARLIEKSVPQLPPRKPVERDRIRVGYVSSDFYSHATSFLMAELLEQHDRRRFEVYLYSHGIHDGSEMGRRVQASTEHFVELRDATAPEMIRRIRQDEIDILVDLKGYTKESRFQIFAARPAPVQVSYLGFPGSSGANFIDYIVGDPWVTPLSDAHHYSEKIAQMPICYQCNDGKRPLPQRALRAEHHLPEDALVLCGFNQPYKISPEVFDVWCRLLRRIPQAVLWLLDWGGQAVLHLSREAVARGVDPGRLIFGPVLPPHIHLGRMACADLFLDTWPCNGHTTVSDALWAGLPVVTHSGRTFASRVAGSLLRAVGMPHSICETIDEYEARVIEIAMKPRTLLELRARVETARTSAPLFSGNQAARSLENLYTIMWKRAIVGECAAHIDAEPLGTP